MANATIIDVAKHAGVSIKTVSRVINNVKTVKPQIRERVTRAIEKLDYHPNPSARGLGGNRSYLLGLLYDVSCGYYATSVLAGATERSRAAKYQIVMQSCDYNSPTLADDLARNIRQSRVDGVMITPPLSDLGSVSDVLESHNIPFVRIAPGKHADTYRSVFTNDRESCASMTEQLASLGHQRISFIIGNPDHAAVMDRYRGYLDGLRACGSAAGQGSRGAGLQLTRLGRAMCAEAAERSGRRNARPRFSRVTTRWRPARCRSLTAWDSACRKMSRWWDSMTRRWRARCGPRSRRFGSPSRTWPRKPRSCC